MRWKIELFFAILCLLAALTGCPGNEKNAPKAPKGSLPEGATYYLDDTEKAAAVLPPANFALLWVDIAEFRKTDLWTNLKEMGGKKLAGLPLQTIIEKIDYAALGLYPSKTGIDALVLAEGDFDADEIFADVKDWAAAQNVQAQPFELKQRRAVKIKNSVFIRLDRHLYASGPEVLVTYSADLLDQKKTASASSASLSYLFAKSRIEDSMLDAFLRVPHVANDWLTAKRIESLIGGCLMLSTRYGEKIAFHLGVLPGSDIRPIWLANELHTFFVRSAKDGRIKKLGLATWVEGLEAKLLDKGVVVKGNIDEDKLLAALREALP
jgi:hypothetical protein